MIIAKKVRLYSIEIVDACTIFIKLKKSIVNTETNELFKEEWHRITIPPGADPEEQMLYVNGNLNSMGFESVESKHLEIIKTVAQSEHTESVKDAFAAKQLEGKI